MSAPHVVALGGGHGLFATLTALRSITSEITAIVTVADNGGSSGRLREEFPIFPPGDLRMALAALCGDDEWGRSWAQIMQYRFTSDGPLNGHAVGNLLLAALWDPGSLSAIRINVLSFGFKYGIPVDSDLLLDARFIPNPHWVPELRPLTGLDEQVFTAVTKSEGVEEFIRSYVSVLLQMIPGYLREGKRFVTLAIGCTGGKHRSVSVAREIARQLSEHSSDFEISAHATHRDVGRE